MLAGTNARGVPSLPAGGGLVVDEVSQEITEGGWSDGNNIRFRDGYAQKSEGYQSVLTAPPATAYHVASYPYGTTRYWIHSGLVNTYADDGATQTDITGTALTGTADNRFTSCVLGGVFVMNNQADVPKYWGGTGTLTSLTGWDANHRCKAIRSHKNYLWALGITKSSTYYGSMVKRSDVAAPGSIPTTWTPASSNDADEFDLAETSDNVVDGLAMGDVFVVYKDRSAYGLQFTGNANVYRAFRLPGGHGMLTQSCAAEFPGGHVVLTPGPDLVIHQGGEPKSILQGKMRRWLGSAISSQYFNRAFVQANPAKYEVWCCFPSGSSSSCNKALIWNYNENTFAVRDLPSIYDADTGPLDVTSTNTWAADTDTWDSDDTAWDAVDISLADRRLVMGGSSLYLFDQKNTANGTAETSRLERTGLAFGDPTGVKLLRRILPRIDGPTGATVTFQVGGSNDAETSPAWSTPITYTIGSSKWVDCFASGRFLGVRITSSGSVRWRIKSIGFDVIPLGMY